MKALGLLLKVLAAIVLLLVITVGVILMVVDPNDYRDEITQAVKKETGRDLTVANMSLDIFPQLSVNLEKAALSNAPGFTAPEFVAIEKVQIGAAILPLLSKKLEVETLTLHGLKLNLEKDADGKTNWDDLTSANQEPEAKDDNQAQEDHANPLSKLSSLNFGGIDIKDGQVVWSDLQNEQNVTLSNFNLSTSSITFGEFFDVSMSADTAIKQPQINNSIQLNLKAKLEQSGAYALKELNIENLTTGSGIPVEKVKTTLSLPAFELNEQQLSIANLTLGFDIVGGKDFPLTAINGNTQISNLQGDIAKQQFNIENIKLQSDTQGDVIPGGKGSINLSTPLTMDLQAQTLNAANIELNALNIAVKADAKVEQMIDAPVANANLSVAQFNLRKLLTDMQIALPEMSDANTLKAVSTSLNVAFAQKAESIKVNNLKLKLDDSNLTGSAAVKGFSNPAIAYNLNLDQINVNRYLPAKETTAPATENAPAEQDAKIELPKEQLRKLNIDGTIKVGKLTYDNLKPTNILVTTKAAKGDIRVSPIQADIFKTRVNAAAGINVAGETPVYKAQTNTKNLPIGEVLIAFTGDDMISGTGTLNADITTSGERVSEFKKALNGTVAANLTDGAVKGFNLAQAIRSAKAKLGGKTEAASSSEEKTDFSELDAKLTIENGIVNTETLTAKAPFMRINGSGTVNLPKETLDYLVKTKIVASDKGQGGEELKDLNGLTIPVKLKGSYLDPKISLDLESLVEQKAKAELEKKKEKVVEDVKKKAEDKLKDLIPKGFKF